MRDSSRAQLYNNQWLNYFFVWRIISDKGIIAESSWRTGLWGRVASDVPGQFVGQMQVDGTLPCLVEILMLKSQFGKLFARRASVVDFILFNEELSY